MGGFGNIYFRVRRCRSPFVMYAPLILLYAAVILYVFYVVNDGVLIGDERRYLMYGNNLLHGLYSPLNPVHLWNGPGYPLFLLPFEALNLPVLTIKLANAVLYYLSIVYLYKLLCFFMDSKYGFYVALLYGLDCTAYKDLALVYTEQLTVMVMVLFLYNFCRYLRSKAWPSLISSGLLLGYLVTVKVIFWYVVVACALIYGAAYLVGRSLAWPRRGNLLPVLLVFVIAVCVVTPYFYYTYALTGKKFYLADSGGLQLYWMTSPHAMEYGDWQPAEFLSNNADFQYPDGYKFLEHNHMKDLAQIQKLASEIEKDDYYKTAALQNIKEFPVKYLKNCVSNIGRMLFNYPYSYHLQTPGSLLHVLVNAPLLLLMICSVPLTVVNIKNIEMEIGLTLTMLLTYLCFTVSISAYPRQFYVIVPYILVWISYVLFNTVTVSVKKIESGTGKNRA